MLPLSSELRMFSHGMPAMASGSGACAPLFGEWHCWQLRMKTRVGSWPFNNRAGNKARIKRRDTRRPLSDAMPLEDNGFACRLQHRPAFSSPRCLAPPGRAHLSGRLVTVLPHRRGPRRRQHRQGQLAPVEYSGRGRSPRPRFRRRPSPPHPPHRRQRGRRPVLTLRALSPLCARTPGRHVVA